MGFKPKYSCLQQLHNMSNNRYQFTTELGGYVQLYKDGGKYNTRSFAYTITQATLAEVEADRVELIK